MPTSSTTTALPASSTSSGHASQEEQRLMINLLRPKFFIPIHGDYRHLKKHAEVAQRLGVVDLAITMENGDDPRARPQ